MVGQVVGGYPACMAPVDSSAVLDARGFGRTPVAFIAGLAGCSLVALVALVIAVRGGQVPALVGLALAAVPGPPGVPPPPFPPPPFPAPLPPLAAPSPR